MNIISKQYDYYDGLSKSLDHSNNYWDREQKVIKDYLEKHLFYVQDKYINLFIIGFCGEIFTCFTTQDISLFELTSNNPYTRYHFDYETPIKLSNWWGHNTVQEIKNDNKLLNIFEKEQAPIFVLYGNTLITNPILKNFQFYKTKDVYQCYQEIDTYLSSGIFDKVVNDDILTDNEKLHSHGMFNGSFKHRK